MVTDPTSTDNQPAEITQLLAAAAAMGFGAHLARAKIEVAALSAEEQYALVRRLFWQDELLSDDEIRRRLQAKPVAILADWIIEESHVMASLRRDNRKLRDRIVQLNTEREEWRKAFLVVCTRFETLLAKIAAEQS